MMNRETKPSSDQDAEHRVAVVCPKCRRGYKIAPALLGRRLVCKECKNEWRARRSTPEEIRSSLSVHRKDVSSEIDRSPGSSDLPPSAGGSVAIDMSWAGRRIGRYRARSLLGHGGMGVVWRAHDDALRRDVALKILTPTREQSSKSGLNLDLFMQEARAVAKLNHPSVVAIYEVAEDEGHVFLSLELMAGGTLKEYVDRNGPIEPRRLFGLMAGPAKALALAHRRGVIHRDIKPGNLMFDDNDHLKLMDFGLADVADEAASERLRGKAVGSLGWIAPETSRGQTTTAVSDIYSMGLVLYYALTGKPLVHGKSRTEVIAMHQNPPDPNLVRIKGLSPRARRMLERCLAVDPAQRYQSTDELAAALQACADEDPSEKTRRRKTGVSIAFMAALVGIFAGVGATLYYVLELLNEQQRLGTPGMPFLTQQNNIVLQQLGYTMPPPAPSGPVKPDVAEESAESSSADRLAREAAALPEITEENRHKPWTEVIVIPADRFIASQRGRVFHDPEGLCGARHIAYGNLIIFDTIDAAIESGRAPCTQCKPARSDEPKHDVVIGPSDHDNKR